MALHNGSAEEQFEEHDLQILQIQSQSRTCGINVGPNNKHQDYCQCSGAKHRSCSDYMRWACIILGFDVVAYLCMFMFN